MKRSPLKRGAPLQRKTRLRARSKTSSYRRRPRDIDRMMFIKRLPCAARNLSPLHPCTGKVEADHAGRRGVGQKAYDDTVISLCQKHHVNRTNFTGPFKRWKQDTMREWLIMQIEHHRKEYEMHLAREARRG